jgi:hypothetical protein
MVPLDLRLCRLTRLLGVIPPPACRTHNERKGDDRSS